MEGKILVGSGPKFLRSVLRKIGLPGLINNCGDNRLLGKCLPKLVGGVGKFALVIIKSQKLVGGDFLTFYFSGEDLTVGE